MLFKLQVALGHIKTSPSQGLHIAVTTNSYSISLKSGVHPRATLQAFPLTNFQHSLYHAPFFLLAYHPTLFVRWINLPLPWLTYWATSHTLSQMHPLPILSFPILSIWSKHRRTFSSILSTTPFVILQNSLISVFGTLSILLIPNNTLRLSICTALTLDLSFSLHIIVSLPYRSTGTSNAHAALSLTQAANS